MFNVNFRILAQLITPTFLRKPVVLAWLYAALAPVASLYERFMLARDYDLLRESTSSTVPRLEYLLNHTFYPDGLAVDYGSRIKVITEKSSEQAAIYFGGVTQAANEEKPLYLPATQEAGLDEPQPIYTYDELGVVGVDFSVIVPRAAQPYDKARMQSLIRTYMLPDKTFTIIEQ